jgi:hypothetical protein
MTPKTTIIFLLFAVFMSVPAFAQDDAMLSSIFKYNDVVNGDIAADKLYSHRITLNSESAKVRFWGRMNKYSENVTCYFELKEGVISLKKIIILADITDRQSYTDLLYDANGNPSLVFYTNNLKNPGASNDRYVYSGKKLIYFSTTKNTDLGAVTDSYDETNFETKQINDALTMLEKAENYKKAFDALVKVQLAPQ